MDREVSCGDYLRNQKASLPPVFQLSRSSSFFLPPAAGIRSFVRVLPPSSDARHVFISASVFRASLSFLSPFLPSFSLTSFLSLTPKAIIQRCLMAASLVGLKSHTGRQLY